DSETLVISAAFLPPDVPAEAVQRIHDLWASVSPYLKGAYGNFMTESGETAVAAIYPPETRARLAEIKYRFDPENLFNQNQNILPVAR
ncbi:MAG TPA: BBE domain-containing protein, partial [Glaciibacter sp.]|nr:BBE domain-containing protein [Glaciibacter sp.]